MKKVQMNKKHMIEATLSYLDENSPLWQSIAKIGEVKNTLNELNEAIDEAAEAQEKSQVNLGKAKQALKRTICQKADILNDLVEVFAEMNGNEELALKMSGSTSDLYKMKNDETMIKIKAIIAAANENQKSLISDYGLTAEQITSLQADYDHFQEMEGKPREYRVKTGVATKNIEELSSQAGDLLNNKLDNLMKIFKRRDANLYNGYLKARIIVDI